MRRQLFAAITTLLIFGHAYAESDGENGTRHEHRGPPEVALEACASSVQGDPCSFEGRRGEALEGTCEAPDDKPLACRPEGAPPKDDLQRRQR